MVYFVLVSRHKDSQEPRIVDRQNSSGGWNGWE